MKVAINVVFAISMILAITFLTNAISSNSPLSAKAQVKNRQLTVRKGSNSRKNTRTLEDVSRGSHSNGSYDERNRKRKGNHHTLNFRKGKHHKPSYQRYHKHKGNHPVR